jgi:hypothetical protein
MASLLGALSLAATTLVLGHYGEVTQRRIAQIEAALYEAVTNYLPTEMGKGRQTRRRA